MKDMNQRLFVVIALWLGVVVLLNVLFPRQFSFMRPHQQKQAEAPAATAPPPQTTPAPEPQVPAPAVAAERAAAPRPPTQKATLETPRLRVVATSDGGGMESIQLLGDKFRRHKQGTEAESSVDLVQSRAGEPLPFSTVLKSSGGEVVIPADAAYAVVRHDATSVTFKASGRGATLTKTLRLDPAAYKVELVTEVTGLAGGTLSVLSATHAEEPRGGFFSGRSAMPARSVCGTTTGDVERENVGAKKPVWSSPSAAFAGIDEQYFLTAVVAPAGEKASCEIEARTTAEKQGSVLASLTVPAAAKSVFAGYAGPKDTDELGAVSESLRHTVDFGFWKVIADVLLGIMKLFHKLVPPHNWGVTIILLTLFVKLVTFPLQHKSMKSMQEMQRIQPQLEELKRKYAGDQQRQNLEQMKLFKEHGVNPMGSCLPMVIQMPVWFALYKTLDVSVELYNGAFIRGWLNDLTAPDPYYILPVAMGITMVLTQVLTPQPMSNPSQKTMGYVMSGVFSLMMLNLPSGLTLYIFTNNILSIVQQVYLRRTLKLAPAPAASQTVKVS